METAARLFAFSLVSFLTAVGSAILGSLLIWLGAHLAGIRNATFGKALAVAILAALVWWIVPGVFMIIPCIGKMIGVVLAFFISLGIVVVVLNCRLNQALAAWIAYIVGLAITQAIFWPFR